MFKLSKIFGNKDGLDPSNSGSGKSGTERGNVDATGEALEPFEFNINIDSAEAVDGALILHGWAYCAKTKINKIEVVYRKISNEAAIGLLREDVKQTFEHCKFSDTGFHFEQKVKPNEVDRKVSLTVTAANGKIYDFKYEIPSIHWNPGRERKKEPVKRETAINKPIEKAHSQNVIADPVKVNKITSTVFGREINRHAKPIESLPNPILSTPAPSSMPQPQSFDFKFHIDITTTASNMLILQGWSFIVDTKVKRIEVLYDGISKDATIGFDRSDVKSSFEQCKYKDTGFYFQGYIDYRTRSQEVKIYIHGENGEVHEYEHSLPELDWFPAVTQKNSNAVYKRYFRNHSYDLKRINALRKQIDTFEFQPLITIIIPVYNVDVQWMELAVESITSQVYTNWELLLIDDKSTSVPLIEYLKTLDHPQIRVHWSEVNGHISKATNIGVSLSTGEYILFMDNDDKLDITALYEVVFALNKNPDADILYSDEDKINTQEDRSGPVFKPDWSPELLLTTNYFNHILVVKKALCEKVKYRSEFDGCQDWDFILRLIEITDKVYHIPKVLYNWRTLEGSISTSGDAKENMSFYDKCEKVINLHLKRNSIPAIAERPQFAKDQGVVLFEINSTETAIEDLSIIINIKSTAYKSGLIESVVTAIGSGNNEIIVFHDGSSDEIVKAFVSKSFKQYKLFKSEGKALSEIFNHGAKEAAYGDLLFLDQQITSVTKQLLLNLQLFAKRDKMGVLGSKLREADNIVHSMGYILGLTNEIYNDLYPTKAFANEENDHGYFFFKQIIKNYSAIGKELFYVKKELFESLDGFDSNAFSNTLFDIDFCMRASKNGYRHVTLPGETKIMISEKEAFNLMDLKHFHDRYPKAKDPFYNENFSEFDLYDYKITDRSSSKIKDAKMRILFCTHNLNFEGAPIHIFEIIEQMVSSSKGNFEIEVYSPVDGPLKDRYENMGVAVNLVSHIINTDPNKFKSELQFEQNIAQIAKWMSGNTYDFVFCNTVLSFEFILAADIASIPSVWNIHESTPITSFFRADSFNIYARLEKAFRVVSEVVFSSKNTADLYKSFLVRNNYTIITNGIKEDEIIEFKSENSKASIRKELGIKEHNQVYLSLGSFGARKGQMDFVLAAIEMLKQHANPKELTFVMVGADKAPAKFSYTDNIHYLIKKSGFKDCFKVLPVVPNVNSYYRASDVFVCTSYNESSPRVILIAMLFDLPIITTPVYGIKEQVIENENALFYSPGDINKLYESMKILFEDRKLLARFADSSKTVLDFSNSHQQMIDAYIQVVETVC